MIAFNKYAIKFIVSECQNNFHQYRRRQKLTGGVGNRKKRVEQIQNRLIVFLLIPHCFNDQHNLHQYK